LDVRYSMFTFFNKLSTHSFKEPPKAGWFWLAVISPQGKKKITTLLTLCL
jgi:hypothetical protein